MYGVCNMYVCVPVCAARPKGWQRAWLCCLQQMPLRRPRIQGFRYVLFSPKNNARTILQKKVLQKKKSMLRIFFSSV